MDMSFISYVLIQYYVVTVTPDLFKNNLEKKIKYTFVQRVIRFSTIKYFIARI